MNLHEIWYWEVRIECCWNLVHIVALKLISSLHDVSNESLSVLSKTDHYTEELEIYIICRSNYDLQFAHLVRAHLHKHCDVYITNKTGSSSVDWIYYQFGYTLTHNCTYTLSIQCYLSFTPNTVHRCTRTRILSLH
jgi:hypothetical protein